MPKRDSQVVTFYSYKGGTGRTMALANVAWILAANGNKVLAADWDLESPGLHRFFAPFLDAEKVSTTGGVVDLILDYEWAAVPLDQNDSRESASRRPPDWHRAYARVEKYAFTINWKFPGGGSLDILLAGRTNQDYSTSVATLNWENFYNRLGGAEFFDALREDMLDKYDYTLLDSRTGLSDVADICTIHLPDVIVDCFTLSDQGIDGAADVAERIRAYEGSRLRRILPVPMRVDGGEKSKADAGRSLANRRFARLPSGMDENQRRDYWGEVEVPYRTYYAYEETLATFGDQAHGQRNDLLPSYERLTGYITGDHRIRMPSVDETLRRQIIARFERKPAMVDETLVLRYAPEDYAWAEWLQAVYLAARLRVIDPGAAHATPAAPDVPTRDVVLYSATYRHRTESPHGWSHRHGDLATVAVLLDTSPAQLELFDAWTALDGLSPDLAIEQVLHLVGVDQQGAADWQTTLPRFPNTQPQVFNAPARNPRFTGRDAFLRRIRDELKGASGTPVALLGGPGIGKSQLATEYAYRFRGAYDVIWWVNADPPQFVDTSLADLGGELGYPRRATQAETTQLVVRRLGRGGVPSEGAPLRWLLIFDNAEHHEAITQFLPQGNGHILVTTRNSDWGDVAEVIDVEVFQREESIEHLRFRTGRNVLEREDAAQVAEAVGDLPILVALAGAWLSETGSSAASYLAALEGTGKVRGTATAVWDTSLDSLRKSSPGAYRLLQLASILQPQISLYLLYSDEVARIIAESDPEVKQQVGDRVSERDISASLVQHINRLALIKLDPSNQQISVHRLLQGAIRDRMDEEQLKETKHAVHMILAKARPLGEVEDPSTWDRYRILWGHLDGSEPESCTHDEVRQMVIERIRYISLAGSYRQGYEYVERANEHWTRLLESMAEDSEDRRALLVQLLYLRFNQGNLLRSLGEFEKALRLDEQTLRAQEQLIGERSPYTLMTASSYGGDLRALGRYQEALERDQQTYRTSSERFGEDNRRTLAFGNNLGTSYRLSGNFRRALEIDQTIYDLTSQVLGTTHPRALLSANNLGRDLREAGEYKRSADLLRGVLNGYKTHYGAHSRDALTVQANLAVSLRSTGDFDEAASLLNEAYDRLQEGLGRDNPDTLLCRLSRAANNLLADDPARARAEFIDTEEALIRRFGEGHPYVLICRNNLAVTRWEAGAAEQARDSAAAIVSAFQEKLGELHPWTLAAINNLAVYTIESGDRGAGEEQLFNVIRGLRTIIGPSHPDTYLSEGNLAIVRQATGVAGDLNHLQIADRLANRIGSEHPSVRSLRNARLVCRVPDPHNY